MQFWIEKISRHFLKFFLFFATSIKRFLEKWNTIVNKLKQVSIICSNWIKNNSGTRKLSDLISISWQRKRKKNKNVKSRGYIFICWSKKNQKLNWEIDDQIQTWNTRWDYNFIIQLFEIINEIGVLLRNALFKLISQGTTQGHSLKVQRFSFDNMSGKQRKKCLFIYLFFFGKK